MFGKIFDWLADHSWLLYLGIIILGIGLSLFRPINKVVNRRDVTVTVTDKTVKNQDKKGKYLVFTEDENGEAQVFEITDSLFALRFDASDDYAKIVVGKKYVFSVGGSRNHFLSWYPNIYEVREVSG